MLTRSINYINFKKKKNKINIKKKLKIILKEDNEIIRSLGKLYKYSFQKKNLEKYKKKLNYRIIGMGGSSLGAKAIYDFLLAIQEPEGMVSLSLLVVLLFITAIVTI